MIFPIIIPISFIYENNISLMSVNNKGNRLYALEGVWFEWGKGIT